MYGYGFLLSLTGYLGVNLVLTLVRVAGAFAAVTVTKFSVLFDEILIYPSSHQVTTCRKALSIAISFLVFSKPFSIQYVMRF